MRAAAAAAANTTARRERRELSAQLTARLDQRSAAIESGVLAEPQSLNQRPVREPHWFVRCWQSHDWQAAFRALVEPASVSCFLFSLLDSCLASRWALRRPAVDVEDYCPNKAREWQAANAVHRSPQLIVDSCANVVPYGDSAHLTLAAKEVKARGQVQQEQAAGLG